MTHRAVGFGRGFPRSWIFPIGALTLLLGVAATGRLSRSIAADLIAWWPVWLGLGILAFLLRDRKIGTVRAAGLVPLLALVLIGVFTWGHLAGWALMPSASQRLVGPEPTDFSDVSLTAEIDGEIHLGGGGDFTYVVEPVMRGGAVGIPSAAEQTDRSSLTVVLQPPDDPGIYSYAGWDITLSSQPTWDLTLDGAVEADLTGLRVASLEVAGAGSVRLGATTAVTRVTITGDYRVIVPDGVPARVVGVATVPADWVVDAEGAAAPGGGEGWVITVAGEGSLSVNGG